jgi:hypothetical protein
MIPEGVSPLVHSIAGEQIAEPRLRNGAIEQNSPKLLAAGKWNSALWQRNPQDLKQTSVLYGVPKVFENPSAVNPRKLRRDIRILGDNTIPHRIDIGPVVIAFVPDLLHNVVLGGILTIEERVEVDCNDLAATSLSVEICLQSPEELLTEARFSFPERDRSGEALLVTERLGRIPSVKFFDKLAPGVYVRLLTLSEQRYG